MENKDIRVLHVIPNLRTGGAEKLIIDSILKYKEQGIQVDLLVLDGKRYPFYDQLASAEVNIFDLGEGSVYNPFHVFRIISHIKNYDIVHVHLFPSLYWVAFAKIIAFSKIRLVYTEHSTTNKRRGKVIWRFLDKFVYKQYSKIVSITEEVQTALKAHLTNIDIKRYCIINNGINLDLFKRESRFPLDNNVKKIIQVSRFKKPKDQMTLIKAIKYLPSIVELNLVGEGMTEAECEQLVKDLELEDRVHFLGVRSDIPQLLNDSDIVVLSSEYEGLSLSCIEGMISGRPFIASDAPGLGDLVRGAGVLFPIGDDKKLADEIEHLLSDQEHYKKVVASCQKKASEYDINVMVDDYIKLYKDILS